MAKVDSLFVSGQDTKTGGDKQGSVQTAKTPSASLETKILRAQAEEKRTPNIEDRNSITEYRIKIYRSSGDEPLSGTNL